MARTGSERLVLSALILLISPGAVAAAENVGRVQQPIVAGTLVDTATQQARGLVIIGGGCSGTLLNRYWVLTADHCLSTNGLVGGPTNGFGNLRVTANWSSASVTPTRVVRNWAAKGLDVALLFLGNGDFGAVPTQLLNSTGIDTGARVTKFGRGISQFAAAGPPATAAVSDGSYRMAAVTVDSIGSTTYTFRPNKAGQIANGGDSGGPDWTTGPNGGLLNIAGVQSTCLATGHVPGMPQNWNWATGIESCDSAPLWNIYYELVEVIRPEHVTFCQDYSAKATAAANENQALGCKESGPRWTTSASNHFGWCVELNGNREIPNAETAARTSAIEQCKTRTGLITLEQARRFPPELTLPDGVRGGSGVAVPRGDASTDLKLSRLPQAQPQSPAGLIPPPNPAPGVNFSGEWQTVTSGTEYRMTLSQDGAGHVSGEYQPAGSSDRYQIVGGAVVGRELVAQWIEGSATGLAKFALAADGNTFAGAWASGANMPAPPQNSWTGARVPVVAAPPDPPAPPDQPPSQAGLCGPPGGKAVVLIPDPNVSALNVRDGPGGRVLTTIREGTEVSIIGECGAAGTAGIVAPSAMGWCQLDSPISGCVSARFLAFGGEPGTAGIVANAPAGIVPRQDPATVPDTPPATVPPAGAVQAARVKTAANVRAGPNGKIIGKLAAGVQIPVSGCEGQWCRVILEGGGSAWVHLSLLQLGEVAAAPLPPADTPPQGQLQSGAPAPIGCGIPAGPATVVIADPAIHSLNVRESPGGKVITAIPKGSSVSVLGECGPALAAGIVAQPDRAPASGWCQIDAPLIGCVAARYLAAGVAAPPPAAGIVANVPVAPPETPAPSFGGVWDTSVDGVPHSVSLRQEGDRVSGTYQGADGSTGRIDGTARAGVLRFSWTQADGQAGAGKFSMASDGNSFAGTYSFSGNADQADGPWTGSRR